MKLSDIKVQIASYLGLAPADLTVNGMDLALVAINQVKQQAEMNYDFEFTRQLVTLLVDGATGGSLNDVNIFGTTSDAEVKTILEVGLFDHCNNLTPIEWTTVAESLERQRDDNRYTWTRDTRYAHDGPRQDLNGETRFAFTGRKVFRFPKVPNVQFTLGLECYTFTPDYTPANMLDPMFEDEPWCTKGAMYLVFQSVVHINNIFKEYLPRLEGALPPPSDLAAGALATFTAYDTYFYEQFRRHPS